MAVLVGIYLIQSDAFEVMRDGKMAWTGMWTLFRSPGLDRSGWEALIDGTTIRTYASLTAATSAAEVQGIERARELQGDDWLEPVSWAFAPSIRNVTLKRASGGHYH